MGEPSIDDALDDLARDVDLLVYRLERKPPEAREALVQERDRLRRELERVRDRLQGLVRGG